MQTVMGENVIRGITPADLAAAEAVVRDATEAADSIGFEEAADMRAALVSLAAAVKDAIAIHNGELLRMVEAQPRRHNGFTYDRRPKRKWRFDHELVRGHIVNTILDTYGPEARSSTQRALDLHSAIYVSPSTEAKVGGLDKIGLTKKEAGTYTNDGYELDVVDTNIRDENDE